MLERAKILSIISKHENIDGSCLAFFIKSFKWPPVVKAMTDEFARSDEQYLTLNERQKYYFVITAVYYSQPKCSPLYELQRLIGQDIRITLQELYFSGDLPMFTHVNAVMSAVSPGPFVLALKLLYEKDRDFYTATQQHIPIFDRLVDEMREHVNPGLVLGQNDPAIIRMREIIRRRSFTPTPLHNSNIESAGAREVSRSGMSPAF